MIAMGLLIAIFVYDYYWDGGSKIWALPSARAFRYNSSLRGADRSAAALRGFHFTPSYVYI
jgi:hypothetical protein